MKRETLAKSTLSEDEQLNFADILMSVGAAHLDSTLEVLNLYPEQIAAIYSFFVKKFAAARNNDHEAFKAVILEEHQYLQNLDNGNV